MTRFAIECGYLAEKALPNGEWAWVSELTFGRGRIIIGDELGIRDGY